jgi:hypothetical protein
MMPLPRDQTDLKPQKQSNRKVRLLVCLVFGALAIVVGVSILYTLFYPAVWTERLSIMNATSQHLTITEYRYATNVSYDTLMMFLNNDTSDMADYVSPNYTCGDFAVHLHDDAEAQGIRCGIVGVSLNVSGYSGLDTRYVIPSHPGVEDNSDMGHGFTVFNTTDRGLVYIDATGVTSEEKAQGRQPRYMVVYFKQDMPLGEICVNQSESLDYSYYQQKESQYQAYNKKISDYNDEVKAINAETKAFNITFKAYTSDLDAYDEEYDRFSAELNDLEDANVSQQEMPEQLDLWREGLIRWQDALDVKLDKIKDQKNDLDAKKKLMNEKRAAIEQSEEAHWEMSTPLGVVDNVVVYW